MRSQRQGRTIKSICSLASERGDILFADRIRAMMLRNLLKTNFRFPALLETLCDQVFNTHHRDVRSSDCNHPHLTPAIRNRSTMGARGTTEKKTGEENERPGNPYLFSGRR
jgi:hypothetical protein